ncbi:Hypothetical protein POVR2_LOCUS402 [uncultured virus]|nr:Hypothetical protein POVR2_LOCUS402 [uncultured virus]
MNRSTPEQALPEALLNEPFTDNDNGYRVEIIVPRRRFEFKISQNGSTVFVGGEYISYDRFEYDTIKPRESTTNISVLTVYDTCGLAIANKYIDRCKTLLPVSRDSSMKTYLTGSIVAVAHALRLDSSTFVDGTVIGKCEILMSLLEQLEERSLAGASSIVEVHQLPIEVVALITGSLRISKAISALVLMKRSQTLPPEEAVMGWSHHEGVSHSQGVLCSRVCKTTNCYYQDHDNWYRLLDIHRAETPTLFTLHIAEGELDLEWDIVPAPKCSSLYSYHNYAVRTRCSGSAMTSLVLDKLQQACLSIDQVCSWVVQLSSDTESKIELHRVTEDELRCHLVHLINSARTIDFGIDLLGRGSCLETDSLDMELHGSSTRSVPSLLDSLSD